MLASRAIAVIVAAVPVLVAAVMLRAGADATLPPAAPDDQPLPNARGVPEMQMIPLPHEQASFQRLGREVARYYFTPTQYRPYWFPIIGPAGVSYTRMGHPHDPHTHGHHDSVWISHQNVGGWSFWENSDKCRIVHQLVEEYFDSPTAAGMLTRNAWQTREGKVILLERRRSCAEPLELGDWRMLIDLQLEAPGKEPVVLGQTPFGIIGVRMAKTIGAHDGGGRILNSAGGVDEKGCFRKPAKWVDYSGPVTPGISGGITLMDHPGNPGHPQPFHVRDDGWMGACLTLNAAVTIQPGKPLRLRYGLWVHAGVPKLDQAQKQWQAFAKLPLPAMVRSR